MVTPTNDHELKWHIESRLGPLPIKQASCKSVLPYYYPAHVANSDQLSDQGQNLAHAEDHIIPSHTYTPLEERVTNTIKLQHRCDQFRLAAKLCPFQRPPLGLFPQGRANKI